ncbi:MAG TPA: hypothetical protein DD730_16425 [Desulfosporosinus sp.]|nr:hypothetical protein [Desulfosporosinus sp.]
MSNEPVDAGIELDGPDKLGEQQQTSEPNIHFRIKPHEITIYHRMADYFWIQRLIKKPSLHLLARACLNIVANKWAKLEEENYNQYVGRVVEEAESLSRQPANPCTSNPPYCGSIEAHPDSQPVRKPASIFGGTIPPQLRYRRPPIEKIEVPWW